MSKVSKRLQNLSKQKLYNLSDLSPVKTWNYELPTLTNGPGFVSRQHWQENSTFWKNFASNSVFRANHQKSSFLLGLGDDLSSKGRFSDFAIFGGSIVDVLLDSTPNDLDIAVFVKGKNNKEKMEYFLKKVNLFMETCINWMEEQNKIIHAKIDQGSNTYNSSMLFDIENNDSLKINRYRNVFTVVLPCCDCSIQFIPKNSIDELLNQIDIDQGWAKC